MTKRTAERGGRLGAKGRGTNQPVERIRRMCVSPEFPVGGMLIVGPASEPKVLFRSLTTARNGQHVVEFEERA